MENSNSSISYPDSISAYKIVENQLKKINNNKYGIGVNPEIILETANYIGSFLGVSQQQSFLQIQHKIYGGIHSPYDILENKKQDMIAFMRGCLDYIKQNGIIDTDTLIKPKILQTEILQELPHLSNIVRLSMYLKAKKNRISLALGDFVLSKKIGQGGNGIVYKASIINTTVAIKFLITDAVGKSKHQKFERFIAEYFNIVTLENQTNIIRYIDYDYLKLTDANGELQIPIIIMRLYEGSLIQQQKNKTAEKFFAIFNFLLNTTERIHKAGIIHRDIKPENILVNGDNYSLADFGIASYNPTIFQLRAQTGKEERLGNRLFSAPEQEEKGVKPHPTMDIYAIGQVLQWYATGKTHRGTGRQKITKTFKDVEVQDKIIEKCLENNPANRFQSIEEIRKYIEQSREKNSYQILRLFHQVCRKNFPKNEHRILHSNNISRIDKLFTNFKEQENEFGNTIWWRGEIGNTDFKFEQKGIGIWKLDDIEYKIKELWIHYDDSIFNDFILVHHIPCEPLIINGQKRYNATLVDNKYPISHSEKQSGYAEIEGDVIDLSGHKVEIIDKESKEGFFFICSEYHCLYRSQNDDIIRLYIEHINTTNSVDIEELRLFEREVRQHKHKDVLMRM